MTQFPAVPAITRLLGTLLLACCAALSAGPAGADEPPLRVTSDDNYPPYIFRDPSGQPVGYLVDLWSLWEQKTGRRVQLIATDWGRAQRLMAENEADVIDMIFHTAARDALYEFSQPYANLPVGIYSHSSISGISNTDNLKGFLIGVQVGDACIEELQGKGVTNLRQFKNYAEMIAAAMAEEIKLFCLDQLPANYYLYRLDLQRQFRKSFDLYQGRFHRATRKGDTATLAAVERGMALMGTGIANGGNRASDAAHKAISSPLLEDISIRGARGILINITSAPDISMDELKEICGIVQEEAHEEAIIKWGLVWDESLVEEIRVTVIATGIGKRAEAERAAWSSAGSGQPEDLEIPTILRTPEQPSNRPQDPRQPNAKKTLGVVAAKKFIVPPALQYEENELDTPPFLRKAD